MKMSRTIVIFFSLIVILVLTSCGVQTIQGSGVVISEARDVSGFDQIELEGLGRVILTQGDEESLTIETDDNLLEYITANVRGQNLQIKFRNNVNLVPTESIIFRIALNDLKSIQLSGGTSIESDRLTLDELEITLNGAATVNINRLSATELTITSNGAGNIVLAGTVDTQQVELNGLGNYTAPDLQSQTTEISIGGAGNAVVWAENTLEVDIDGAGDVSYFGSPTLKEDLGFGGDLNDLGDK